MPLLAITPSNVPQDPAAPQTASPAAGPLAELFAPNAGPPGQRPGKGGSNTFADALSAYLAAMVGATTTPATVPALPGGTKDQAATVLDPGNPAPADAAGPTAAALTPEVARGGPSGGKAQVVTTVPELPQSATASGTTPAVGKEAPAVDWLQQALSQLTGRAAEQTALAPQDEEQPDGSGAELPTFTAKETPPPDPAPRQPSAAPEQAGRPSAERRLSPQVKTSPAQETGHDSLSFAPAQTAATASDTPGEAQPQPAPAVAAQVAASIASHATLVANEGRAELHLQLEPPELGTVRIHLTAVDNTVSARLVVQHEATRQVLETQLHTLRQSLTEAGVTLADLNVSHGHGGNQGQWQRPPPANATPPGADNTPATAEAQGQAEQSPSRIDLVA